MSEAELHEELARTARALGRTTARLDDTKMWLELTRQQLAEAEEAIIQLREMLERAHA